MYNASAYGVERSDSHNSTLSPMYGRPIQHFWEAKDGNAVNYMDELNEPYR